MSCSVKKIKGEQGGQHKKDVDVDWQIFHDFLFEYKENMGVVIFHLSFDKFRAVADLEMSFLILLSEVSVIPR